jgi:predicted phosphodiesterase
MSAAAARIAVVSDVHGNRHAFEAVLRDLRETAPDLVLHGGDLADGGSSPAEVVDEIRSLGWKGVLGNGEEAVARPETLEEFAGYSSAPAALWNALREMMSWTRAALGHERVAGLGALPRMETAGRLGLVHASLDDTWRAPGAEAGDAELLSGYVALRQPVAVYGHIHRPFVRAVGNGLMVANSGSVGLPYDGDPRASYLIVDGSAVTIRRVDYDVEKEIQALKDSGLPYADWVARILRSAAPQMP